MTAQVDPSDRSAAWFAGLPALLFVAVIAHHPVLDVSRDASVDAVIAGVSRIAFVNAAFHGLVLLLVSAQTIGLWSLAARLGLHRIVVRAGLFFYGVATLLLFVAGTVDGFATPSVGFWCSTDKAQCANALAAVLSTESAWIQAFTKVGLAAQALGLACWSVTLAFHWRAALRTAGLVGLLLALGPLALLSADHLIGPGRLALLVSCGCVWTLGASVLLWTGALVTHSH